MRPPGGGPPVRPMRWPISARISGPSLDPREGHEVHERKEGPPLLTFT